MEGDELHYLARVRRARPGDKIVLLCENGSRFTGKVVHLGEGHGEATVEERLPDAPRIWPVHLLVAVAKHHLMDELIRRVSEIGIETLVPISTERGVQQSGKTRQNRWKKIAAESQRQCLRAVPLRIENTCQFGHALAQKKDVDTGYLFHPRGPGLFSPGLAPSAKDTSTFLVIGPEGGFSAKEVELAASLGYRQVGLGSTIMRIETAAVAASVLTVALLGGYSQDPESV